MPPGDVEVPARAEPAGGRPFVADRGHVDALRAGAGHGPAIHRDGAEMNSPEVGQRAVRRLRNDLRDPESDYGPSRSSAFMTLSLDRLLGVVPEAAEEAAE
jgi:hypothetical protein